MKGKYITRQLLLACQSRKIDKNEDIHHQLAATIAAYKSVMEEWEKFLLSKTGAGKPACTDIHTELAETIAEYKRVMQQWGRQFARPQETYFVMPGKKAA